MMWENGLAGERLIQGAPLPGFEVVNGAAEGGEYYVHQAMAVAAAEVLEFIEHQCVLGERNRSEELRSNFMQLGG